jgi:hypothetical protein
MMARLQKLGPRVNVEQKEEPDRHGGEEYRYVAVAE